jgi:polygalacturonase
VREFLGPFASWINVVSAHRAAGDGVTDDTAALQAALDEVVEASTVEACHDAASRGVRAAYE